MRSSPAFSLSVATGLLLVACCSTTHGRRCCSHRVTRGEVEPRPQATSVGGLAALGRVRMLIYVPPAPGEEIASGSIVFWEFESGFRAAFSPGDFVAEPGDRETGHIKITDIVRHPTRPRTYRIHYAVYEDTNEPPTRTGFYEYAAPERPAAPRRAKTAAPAEPREWGEFKPVVTWESPTHARVVFDAESHDYFAHLVSEEEPAHHYRPSLAEQLGVLITTVEARDAAGHVRGLEITRIQSGTPLAFTPIQEGDIFLRFGGLGVQSRSDVVYFADQLPANAYELEIVLEREGAEITVIFDLCDPRRNPRR